jgi:hypothetical protein
MGSASSLVLYVVGGPEGLYIYMHNSNISPLRGLRFQSKSSRVHAFRSHPQQLEEIHVYIRKIFNHLYFRILTLFNFF